MQGKNKKTIASLIVESQQFDHGPAVRIEREILIRQNLIFRRTQPEPKKQTETKNENRFRINWNNNEIFDRLEPETEQEINDRLIKISMGKEPRNNKHFKEEIPIEYKIKLLYQSHLENITITETIKNQLKTSEKTAKEWTEIMQIQIISFIEIINNTDHPEYINKNKQLLKTIKHSKNTIGDFEISRFLNFSIVQEEDPTQG